MPFVKSLWVYTGGTDRKTDGRTPNRRFTPTARHGEHENQPIDRPAKLAAIERYTVPQLMTILDNLLPAVRQTETDRRKRDNNMSGAVPGEGHTVADDWLPSQAGMKHFGIYKRA